MTTIQRAWLTIGLCVTLFGLNLWFCLIGFWFGSGMANAFIISLAIWSTHHLRLANARVRALENVNT